MKQKRFGTEAAYLLGLILLAFGAAVMEKADLGMSMVVAPAYLLHLKVSQFLPFFSFGMAEYTLQAVLLIAMTIALRKFRGSYLFSFVTAVLYGFMLDGCMLLLAAVPASTMLLRIVFYLAGMLLCSCGIAFLFHTYLPPEVYELVVKEVSSKYGFQLHKCKTCYDCISCFVGICLSFAFFGFGVFEGVKLGTIFCALVNGPLIGGISKLFERCFVFTDQLPLRKYFN